MYKFIKNKIDFSFILIITAICIILFYLPTGFEQATDNQTIRVKGHVIATDNSMVKQIGLTRLGEQEVTAVVLSGSFKNDTVISINHFAGKMDIDKFFKPGDHVLLVLDLDPEKKKIVNSNSAELYRLDAEIVLLLLFIILLIFFAGSTGIRAVLTFIFTGLTIYKLLIPFLLKGYQPICISLIAILIITFVIIFLVAGFNKKGLTAFLGAFCGIIITAIIALLANRYFYINGAIKPFAETLLYSGFASLNLTDIFLCGVFISSSGAVMDVATDIAFSQYEISIKKPDIPVKELIISGFTISKAIIGTMTTTLLLAYSGGYLTLLMVFTAHGIPSMNILNLNHISAEILYTLVGSFGLITVAPFTSIIGGFLFQHKKVFK